MIQRTSSLPSQPIASFSDWQLSWRENRNNILTLVLALFVIYLCLYYLLIRNPETSLINSYVVYMALGFLLISIAYLQLSKYFQNRQEAYEPVRPDQRYQVFLNEARREHILNNLKRDMKSKDEPAATVQTQFTTTPQFTRLSPYTTQVQPLGRYEGTTTLGDKRETSSSRYWNPLSLGRQQVTETTPMMLPNSGQSGDASRRLPTGSPKKPGYLHPYQNELSEFELQMNNSQADKLYERLGIKAQLPLWVENLKNWMGGRFIPALLERHNENLDKLNKVLYEYGRRVVFQEYETISSSTPKPILWEELYDTVINNRTGFEAFFPQQTATFGYGNQSVNDSQRRAELRELVKDRKDIERYLRIKECTIDKREYVIGRLKELAKDFMEEYSNNAGGSFRGEPWSPAYPRDSDIVSWLFFRMIIRYSFGQSSDDSAERSTQFVTYFPNVPPTVRRPKEEVWFYRSNSEKNEPHWNIYSGGELWYCRGGRNNFFYAAALMLYHLRVNANYTFGNHNYKDLIDAYLN